MYASHKIYKYCVADTLPFSFQLKKGVARLSNPLSITLRSLQC